MCSCCPPSDLTNHPLAHSLRPGSDMLSPDLTLVSTSMPTDDPQASKDLKSGSGAKLDPKEVGKIQTQGKSYRHATTIDTLTDDILLEIFGFILMLSGRHYFGDYPLWKWHRLVHVCRRWQQIVFSSPLRLDLELLCTYGTPVWERLACWPAFPLAIDYGNIWDKDITPQDEVNIFAALKQRDRVRHIYLNVSNLLMEKLFAVMEEPFSALTHLLLSSKDDWDPDEDRPVIPSKLLGGCAPLLHEVSFYNIPFPTIPAFLSSASDLVKLRLENIPPTPFPSPKALVACVAALTRLEVISIEFQSDLSTPRPNQIRLPPETRVDLSALASFIYEGDNAYLDDFVAQINTPRLNSIDIKYTEEDMNPRVTGLTKLIERSNFQLSQLGFADIFFENRRATFLLRPQSNSNEFAITIQYSSWGGVGGQVADMTLMLSQVSTMISHVVCLDIRSERELDEDFMDRSIMENENMVRVRWLELFHPFIAVKTLRISDEFVTGIAHEFEERTVETVYQVLPALKSLYLESEPFMRNIAEGLHNTFQASGRPLTVVSTERL